MTDRFCTGCGAALASDVRFCTSCGQSLDTTAPADPEPTGRGPRTPTSGWPSAQSPWPNHDEDRASSRRRLLTGLVVGVVALVVGALVWMPFSDAQPDPPAPSPVPPSSTAAPTTRSAPSSTSRPASLAQVKSADASAVSALTGSWVPQVSSKQVGLVADGIVYDETAILRDHLRLRAAYPQAVLFGSSRFPTYRAAGFEVTVIAIRYPTAAQANAWCDAAQLPADACFAKRLAMDVGDGRNIVPR